MTKRLLSLLLCVLTAGTSCMAQSADKESYRRSSLCLIMLTHRGKKYAESMERVFKSFPLPARYNEHNISDLRVVSVDKKNLAQSDIDKIVKDNHVAQKMVARWFDRDANTGMMDMDLIHQRGGYGANYARGMDLKITFTNESSLY